MSWANWLVVELSMEQQLEMEKQARSALHHHDADEVRQLCASLIKHSQIQEILLKQATGRVIELEAMMMANSREARPWWQIW